MIFVWVVVLLIFKRGKLQINFPFGNWNASLYNKAAYNNHPCKNNLCLIMYIEQAQHSTENSNCIILGKDK